MTNFLKNLPLELRTLIYRELLTVNDPRPPGVDSLHSSLKTMLHPASLQVCKQTNSEASIILYEGNKFTYTLQRYDDHYLCLDRTSMNSFARIKHLDLAFCPNLYGTSSLTEYIKICGCSLKTLGLGVAPCPRRPTWNNSYHGRHDDKWNWEWAQQETTDTWLINALAAVNVEKELKISVTSIREDRCMIFQDFADALGAKKDWFVATKREVVRRVEEDINIEEEAAGDDKQKRLVWTFTLKPHDVSK